LSGGAVAAVAGGVAAVALLAGPGNPPVVAPTAAPGATAPTPSPGAGATTAAPAGTPGTATSSRAPIGSGTQRASLAVYYVGVDRFVGEGGTQSERPRLFREFRRLAAGDGSPAARTRAAVEAMLSADPADPDYARAWPDQAGVRDVRADGSTVTVDLSGAGEAGTTTLDSERALIAVQELVWTATAASGEPGVRLLLDGVAPDLLWGHVAGDEVLRRAPMVDVAAPVWLIAPQQGAVVGREVDVHVAGFVFEATAQLRVRRGEEVVAERVLTLSAGGPAQGEANVTLTLAPGTYVIEAYELSAVDGSVQHLDDHTVTVR
jgi:hypothetical protein